jgi:hypothetical protein
MMGGVLMAEQIHILCELELKELVTEQSRTEGLSLSAWIVRLMGEELERVEKVDTLSQ